jgi:hypothetical protein
MMAALQGAKVIGADTRCTDNGTSSLSAFIRIARPDDIAGSFYCDLNVPSLPEGMEPIDSLQTLFNSWLETVVGIEERRSEPELLIYPNPASRYLKVVSRQSLAKSCQPVKIIICNMLGIRFGEIDVSGQPSLSVKIDLSDYNPGIYFVTVVDKHAPVITRELIVIR